MMIAGVLALLLASQGFALAVSPQTHFTPAGAGAGHPISLGNDDCGTPGDGEKYHDHHGLCCLLVCGVCGSSYLPAPTGAAFKPSHEVTAIRWAVSTSTIGEDFLPIRNSARGPPQVL